MKRIKTALFQTWEIALYAILIAVLSVNAYWYYEKDSYEISTISISNQTIGRGGMIGFERYVCPRKQDVKAKVTTYIRFEDGYMIRVGGYAHPPVKKCGTIGLRKLIPYYIGSGNYEYVVVVEYSMNPLKSMTKVLAPIKFTVIDENEKEGDKK